MDFHTWACMGFGAVGCRKAKQNSPINSQANDLITLTDALKTEKAHALHYPSAWRTTANTWPVAMAVLRFSFPLSHPFSKKTATLHLNVIGSDICTALVAWYCTCVHCCLFSLLGSSAVLLQPWGWCLFMMFGGGGRCVVGCLFWPLVGRICSCALCTVWRCALGSYNGMIVCCFPPITHSKLQWCFWLAVRLYPCLAF